MNEPNDREYYVARAASSRNLAQRAANPAIAAIHADLAERYEALAERPGPRIDRAITGLQAACRNRR